MLYGPPGTGKTLLARAVAHHTECTFIRVSGSELVQKFIGEGARMVRELFVMARYVCNNKPFSQPTPLPDESMQVVITVFTMTRIVRQSEKFNCFIFILSMDVFIFIKVYYIIIKLVFVLTKRKTIYEAPIHVYFNYFHETVNSHNLETEPTILLTSFSCFISL